MTDEIKAIQIISLLSEAINKQDEKSMVSLCSDNTISWNTINEDLYNEWIDLVNKAYQIINK